MVKKKFDMKEHIEIVERRKWRELINHIYAFWNDDVGDCKNNVKKLIKPNVKNGTYSSEEAENVFDSYFDGSSFLRSIV